MNESFKRKGIFYQTLINLLSRNELKKEKKYIKDSMRKDVPCTRIQSELNISMGKKIN